MTTTPTITAEQIVCPDWCRVPIAQHVADLPEWESCIHLGEFGIVDLSRCTDLAGNDLETPRLAIHGGTLTVSEARTLLADLTRALSEIDPLAPNMAG